MSEEYRNHTSKPHIVEPKRIASFAEDLEKSKVQSRPLYDFNPEPEEPVEEMGEEQGQRAPQKPPTPKTGWRRRLTITGISLFVIWLILVIFPIPFGTIQVVGSQKVTVADVMAAGNIRNPVNLLQINPGHLEERLQHDLRVETVKVSYALPLTLQVTVTDRKAAAVVATQFGFATLDKTGRVINLGPAIEDTTAPIISGVKLGNVLLGDMIENQAIKGALTYLSSLSEEGVKNIAEINVGDTKQLVAYTVDGLPLRLGDMTELDKKGPLSENMLRDIKARGVAAEYVDVNLKAPFIKTP
ncbi:MAG: FtsQ-type POTRA domain-containing protein [Veillonella sp.]|uniref:cell division protein FtsQ/DivIB n=1 Tax=Veillonella sp. TaxID=1926307 RepID=UPI0025E91CDC|nr:FtsQ-type POTRA domain-containing protein [Veillonella sp.]MBS4913754.1 FtsQ-type POTRA domain-containing protein [Veillonella sp.]